jgi:hypothetical protein
MATRWLVAGGVLAAGIVVGLAAVPSAQAPPRATSAAPAKSAWVPHRTPWGDPDLQGNFTNKDEQGIPFERPAEFAGRTTISDAEFAARESDARKQLATDNAEFDQEHADTSNAGAVGSATSPPPHWLDRGQPSRRTSRVVDPPDGRIPPMTDEGKRRAARRAPAPRFGNSGPSSYLDGGLYDRCITRGLPGSMMPAVYGNSYQIVQGPGYVAIRYEMIHETRIIPLESRQHAAAAIRSYMGDARGHWEGATLVVETTNFRPEISYQGANPSTLRLIERFTPVADNKVEWSVTVDDATTWTRPWTFEVDLTRDMAQPVMEYACHEGNYAMTNILTGARAAENEKK